MKRGDSLVGGARAENFLIAILLGAILVALIIPSRPALGQAGGSAKSTATEPFFVAEGDYGTPIISSARLVQKLNITLHDAADFAGYDDFFVPLEIGGKMEVVKAARFSGPLLSLLNLEVVGELKMTAPRAYISESLWERAFDREPNAIGRKVRINGEVFSVAGVVRGQNSFLADVEIWVPVSSRSSAGHLTSMKILGGLKAGSRWRAVEQAIKGILKSGANANELAGSVGVIRIVPLDFGIDFGNTRFAGIAPGAPQNRRT